MTEILKTPLLDQIKTPDDLKKIPEEKLTELAEELRSDVVHKVSKTGGHLGASLGTIELTVALHYLFNAPKDKIIWDVSHQAYGHKVLTDRRDQMHTIRQGGGLSGFTKRSESIYDPFGAAHSSTSISAGLGMSVARDLKDDDFHTVCVIGDGAMSAGMAYEAMNNAGSMDSRLIVILNDNDMSIAPPVGALSAHLSRLISSKPFRSLRDFAKDVIEKLPQSLQTAAKRADEYARGMVTGGTLFEELGFYYVGPIDGHNLDHLIPVLRNIRDVPGDAPVLVHVVTQKGKGYEPAENSSDKYHGVTKFDVVTGEQSKKSGPPSYTSVFAETLIDLAKQDDKIIGITAAMPSGTGMDKFMKAYPDRCFDVGIAEQHAVTFAAGLACEGMKPFASIYSTFLQRGYDQVVHDVALQSLPVRFAIDRAGLVGADGQTHAGAFDIAYLGCLPNFVLMASADEAELMRMTKTAAEIDDRPSAFRYPRGSAIGVEIPDQIKAIEIGKGRVVKQGSKIAILSYGGRLHECLKAAKKLDAFGLSTTVADARFAKPLDETLIADLVKNHEAIILIEEGSIGGFGSFVMQYLAESGLLDQGIKIRSMTLPDIFQDQDTPENQYREAGLNSEAIFTKAAQLIGIDDQKIIKFQAG